MMLIYLKIFFILSKVIFHGCNNWLMVTLSIELDNVESVIFVAETSIDDINKFICNLFLNFEQILNIISSHGAFNICEGLIILVNFFFKLLFAILFDCILVKLSK